MSGSVYLPKNLEECCEKCRIVLITGHYGSGKTEFALNLAFAIAARGKKTAIVDVDIVNPYFRSREKRSLLTERGIRLITSPAAVEEADLPALPGEINATFDDPELFSIFDVGGDPVGARVLGRYAPVLRKVPHSLLVVLNANRPQTADADAAAAYIEAISASCHLEADGIIDNTHLCGETTEEDLARGRMLAEETSKKTGLPVVCHTAERRLIKGDPAEDVFPIDILMKKPWE